jgi:hypothetical protein
MSGRQVRAQYESDPTSSEYGAVIGGSPFAKSGQSLSKTSPPSALPLDGNGVLERNTLTGFMNKRTALNYQKAVLHPFTVPWFRITRRHLAEPHLLRNKTI